MSISDFSWDIFAETGKINAYLIHKNTGEGGKDRNARNKSRRNNIKTDRIW